MTDKTVTSTEDTNKTMPPDWAIEEAIKRSGFGVSDGVTLAWVKYDQSFVWVGMTLTAARLIAQHEPPPVDPLVQIARHIMANEYSRSGTSKVWCNQARHGDHDDDVEFAIALAALKRGVEIGEARAAEAHS